MLKDLNRISGKVIQDNWPDILMDIMLKDITTNFK
jgi:hypothetical protein